MTCLNCDELRADLEDACLEIDRLRVEASGLDGQTVSTLLGLLNNELKARKAELRDCTDLPRRKRLVARIEQLRVAHGRLELVSLAANALRRAARCGSLEEPCAAEVKP